ncbi:hypothetical protein [Sporosarcina sp. NPDC096371]|uniref:hypothetical protein n=1 Tax=Sporosarcina sp. NPDC096371 TaxID=3364530 RepID=UPI0037F96C57
MPNNKDRRPNNDRKQNQKQDKKQDPYQNQDASKNDMRGEFGTAFDIDQLKEQNNNTKTRNNKELDPGTKNF